MCVIDHRGLCQFTLNKFYCCPQSVPGGACHGGLFNNGRVFGDGDRQVAGAFRDIGVRYLQTRGGRYPWNLSPFYNNNNPYPGAQWPQGW